MLNKIFNFRLIYNTKDKKNRVSIIDKLVEHYIELSLFIYKLNYSLLKLNIIKNL